MGHAPHLVVFVVSELKTALSVYSLPNLTQKTNHGKKFPSSSL